jgi:hypothetical protein
MARPSVKTPKMCDEIVEHLRAGRPLVTIAGLVGVTDKTIRNWRVNDEEFDRRCDEALAKWVEEKIDVIEVASKDPKTGPQWARELLRMRLPLQFGDLGTHVATKRLEREEIDDTLRNMSTEDILRELKRRNEEKAPQ